MIYTAANAAYTAADYDYDADAYAAIGAYDVNAYDAAKNLIYRYDTNANQRWPTINKAKAAGKYLYILAKLRLI